MSTTWISDEELVARAHAEYQDLREDLARRRAEAFKRGWDISEERTSITTPDESRWNAFLGNEVHGGMACRGFASEELLLDAIERVEEEQIAKRNGARW